MITTRAAVPVEASQLRDVCLASYGDAYRDLVPPVWLRDRLAQHRTVDWARRPQDERARGGDIVVALDDDRLIGLCQFGATTNEDDDLLKVGHVHRLYVHPAWQRRGAGSALMSLACATLRSQGYAFATLWVLASDTRRARPFYERLGWRSDGTIRPFEAELTPQWAGRLDDVRYRTTL
jgi:GNAT superfamily N-acetyltransferase